jgi:hypothetical protein
MFLNFKTCYVKKCELVFFLIYNKQKFQKGQFVKAA